MNQKTVLLVENDPQFIYLVQRYAETSGCGLIQTPDVNQAMSLAKEINPDLILVDMDIQSADDWSLLRWIKQNPLTTKIPVFVVSASEPSVQRWAGEVDGCLLKPVMYEDFTRVLYQEP